MKEDKWFEYIFADAWFAPIARVTVLKTDENTVIFETYANGRFMWAEEENQEDSIHSITISKSAMERMEVVLKDDKLYEIKELESPLNILDGYIQKLYFFDGVRNNYLIGFNLGYCFEDAAQYPNTMIALKALEEISRILISEGVDPRCFYLEPDGR